MAREPTSAPGGTGALSLTVGARLTLGGCPMSHFAPCYLLAELRRSKPFGKSPHSQVNKSISSWEELAMLCRGEGRQGWQSDGFGERRLRALIVMVVLVASVTLFGSANKALAETGPANAAAVAISTPTAEPITHELWVFAGQSNMVGNFNGKTVPNVSVAAGNLILDLSPRTYEPGTDGKIGPVWDFDHPWEDLGAEQFRDIKYNEVAGISFGPELTFAAARDGHLGANKQVAVVKFGINGSSLADDWGTRGADGNWRARGAGGHFDQLEESLRRAVGESATKFELGGVVWMQGESDAEDKQDSTDYEANLRKLKADFDVVFEGLFENEPWDFVIGRIHDGLPTDQFPHADQIRAAQASVAASDCRSAVDTDDLGLLDSNDDPTGLDDVHFSTVGQKELGKRMADAAAASIKGSYSGFNVDQQVLGQEVLGQEPGFELEGVRLALELCEPRQEGATYQLTVHKQGSNTNLVEKEWPGTVTFVDLGQEPGGAWDIRLEQTHLDFPQWRFERTIEVRTPTALPGPTALPAPTALPGQAAPARAASFNPVTQKWNVYRANGSVTESDPWGTAGDVPFWGDVDGDGQEDFVVWRPSNGHWYGMSQSNEVILNQHWGQVGDIPLLGDVDGDGRDDLITWRPSEGYWYVMSTDGNRVLLNSKSAHPTKPYGNQTHGDIPLLADVDGDGRDEMIIWRPGTTSVNGRFYARNLEWRYLGNRAWGAGRLGDVPMAGDLDGDGVDELVIFRPSTGKWYPIHLDGTRPLATVTHGGLNGQGINWPLILDADGDGADDVVLRRVYDNKQYLYARNSAGQQLPLYGVHVGSGDDIPAMPGQPSLLVHQHPMCDDRAVTVRLALGQPATGGHDVILGTDGVDTVQAGSGNDRICAGAGDDVLSGNGGNDRIWGGDGDDSINGGSGNDVVNGGWGADKLYGWTGDDVLAGNQDNDELRGGDGDDTLHGGWHNDRVWGEAGNDRLVNNNGTDRLDGGAGSDTCRPQASDTLVSC